MQQTPLKNFVKFANIFLKSAAFSCVSQIVFFCQVWE